MIVELEMEEEFFMVRVRYAPSPTGDLHIGNARTALFNYLFAKSQGGKFILRIEDTDVARNVDGGEESQMNFLQWLGIEWDESFDVGGEYGPYRQLERLDIYRKYVDELLDLGLAYKCYCTSAELESERERLSADGVDSIHYSRRCADAVGDELVGLEARGEYVIRFKVPSDVDYVFEDLVRGEVSFRSADVGDWVIMKANGIPTYNFACAIDDHLMEITHVFRGEEHITNTPRQMMVYMAFGWDVPTFAHMTLIVNDEGKKLSKRDSDTVQFIEQYANLGYLPDGLFNFISLLGHSPEGESEILSFDELIKSFDVRRLSKSPSTFDRNKLAFINQCYVKNLEADELLELCMPHLVESGILDGRDMEWAASLVGLFQDRLVYGAEIVDLYDEFFDLDLVIDSDASEFLRSDVESNVKTLVCFKEELMAVDGFSTELVKEAVKRAGKVAGVKGKNLFMPCRIGVSGKMHGPDLPVMVELLGRTVACARIDSVIADLG